MSYPQKLLVIVLGLFAACIPAGAQALKPENVAVVYNAESPHGRELALEYMRLRAIPQGNLVTLICSNNETITRDEFKRNILAPLRSIARERQWWTYTADKNSPLANRKIYAMVLISGVPLRINHDENSEGGKDKSAQQTNAASVDSDLAMMAFDNVPIKGMLGNPYYNKDANFAGLNLPIMLVTRLDSPSLAATRRMMTDAVNVEKKGLWGWAVIDRGGPHGEGDRWLDESASLAEKNGMPLFVDTWKETLPNGYPLMKDVAVYLGWYAGSINGPFAEKDFRFKPGAVAMHIHSYSATTLKNPGAGWSGPLIEKGAAVTVGNVFEPFLGGSHHLQIFYDRLLKGYTVAEAGAMSIPVVSWQSIVLGDPLYRPFSMMDGKGFVSNREDKFFQAWWAANREWKLQQPLRLQKLEAAANANPGSFYFEALGYEALRKNDKFGAGRHLRTALAKYADERDKVRVEMELANISRTGNVDDPAFRDTMERMKTKYLSTPYVAAFEEWKKRATPPPPAPPGEKK